MKKLLVTFFLISGTSTVFAGTSVFGAWNFFTLQNSEIHITSLFKLSEDAVTISATCTSAGQSVSVDATAPAIVIHNQLIMIGEAHEKKTVNGLDCNADIVRGTMGLSLSSDGKRLTLQAPGQPSLTLSRN